MTPSSVLNVSGWLLPTSSWAGLFKNRQDIGVVLALPKMNPSAQQASWRDPDLVNNSPYGHFKPRNHQELSFLCIFFTFVMANGGHIHMCLKWSLWGKNVKALGACRMISVFMTTSQLLPWADKMPADVESRKISRWDHWLREMWRGIRSVLQMSAVLLWLSWVCSWPLSQKWLHWNIKHAECFEIYREN